MSLAPSKLRAIEIFGCSGGMAAGFHRAGITFDLAFDWDADACASYEQNIGHRPIRMDARDLLRMVKGGGMQLGPIDLLVADPPCTPVVTRGQAPRHRRRARHAGGYRRADRPPAAARLPHRQRSRPRRRPPAGDGAAGDRRAVAVRLLHRRLQAPRRRQLRVPQHRIRPFWFGHLAGPCLVWPAPTHTAPSMNLDIEHFGLRPWVTCREALAHLPPEEMGRPVRLRWRSDLHPASELDQPGHVVPSSMPGNGGATLMMSRPPHVNHRRSNPDAPARTLTRNTHSDGALLVNDRHLPAEPDSPAPTIRGGHSAAAVLALNEKHPPSHLDEPAGTLAAKERSNGAQILRERRQGMRTGTIDAPGAVVTAKTDRVGAGAGHVLAWPWDRPSTVVCGGIDKISPAGESGGQFGPNAIVLSERAAAILQGFPPEWVFVGATKRSRWSQLGQAMPPAMAHAVATSIARQLSTAAALPADQQTGSAA